MLLVKNSSSNLVGLNEKLGRTRERVLTRGLSSCSRWTLPFSAGSGGAAQNWAAHLRRKARNRNTIAIHPARLGSVDRRSRARSGAQLVRSGNIDAAPQQWAARGH